MNAHVTTIQQAAIIPMWLPPAVAGLILAALILYYALGRKLGRFAPVNRRREGSVLIPTVAIDFFYWLIDGLGTTLTRLGVRPNHITTSSLLLSIGAGAAFGVGAFGWGACLFAVAAAGDALDGLVARKSGSGSKAGAFLDSTLDRLAEAAVLTGFAVWGAGGWMTWLAIWVLIASYTISYLRARGDSLGYDCPDGLMQRPERLGLMVLAALAAIPVAGLLEPDSAHPVYHAVLIALGAIGALSTWTAIDRGRRIYTELRRRIRT